MRNHLGADDSQIELYYDAMISDLKTSEDILGTKNDLCLVMMCVAAGVSLYIGSSYICTAINYMHIYFITSRVYRSGTCRCTCKSSLGVLTSGQSEGKVSPVPDHNRQYEQRCTTS